MSAATEKQQRQSKRVREFLAKKQEEELAKHDALLSIIQNPTKDNKENFQTALKYFYNMTINKCKGFLSSGDTKEIFKAINILKKLQTDGYDIDNIIFQLLCHGSLLFFQFVKQIKRDLLNQFEAYDKIVNSCEPNEIIELLKFGVLELEYATKINNMESLDATIYMFIQLTRYEDTIQNYLWQNYASIISKQGLLRHMVLRNIPHEIAVYLKSLGKNEFNEEFIVFHKVLSSYEDMEVKYKGLPIVKGRLVNLIRMIVDMVFNQGFEFPSMTEFVEAFNKVYTMKDYTDIPSFLQVLPLETHRYIDMKIYNLKVSKQDISL